jgi:hypothetical protein
MGYNYSLPEALDLSWNEMVFDQLNIPLASLIAASTFYDGTLNCKFSLLISIFDPQNLVEIGFDNHFEGGWNTFSTNYGGTNKTAGMS